MKIKVGVFFGGKSVEHEISVISAVQAMLAFDTEKYDVVPVYISKDNRFFTIAFSHYCALTDPAYVGRDRGSKDERQSVFYAAATGKKRKNIPFDKVSHDDIGT